MPARAVPCCRCLAALAAWKDGAAPVCRDGNSAVTKKCRGCRDLGKPCIGPSGLLKARAIALRAAIAAHPSVRPAAVKEAQAAVRQVHQARRDAAARPARERAERQGSSGAAAEKAAAAANKTAAAAEKTAAAVEKIAMELQQLRGEVAGPAELYRKTHEATVEAPHHSEVEKGWVPATWET
ncbi:hypothetical protein DL764_006856 [Monosporascus ibericus]|uniref:Uncharacterized protein n=1 Tax=Monosporascus ibericus TaxID=155417 RepID=A0A4Q4T3N6_9PEZI|nr:hypothetical protein DL764_006856 [Monosporascus ibericus]